MREIIYSKYNTHREPKYRIRTSIVETDHKRSVEKIALCPEASDHILGMKKNYDLLKETYKSVIPIGWRDIEGGLSFEYIKGMPLDKDIDYSKDSMEEIKLNILKIFRIIFDFNPGVLKEGLVFPANVDSIISNFIRSEGKVYLLDYEWVDSEPVPLSFLQFRCVLYVYREHEDELADRISEEEFLGLFGFKEKSLDVLYGMENEFQYHVHGRNCRFIYPTNYEKQELVLNEEADKKEAELLNEKDEQIKKLGADISHRELVIGSYGLTLHRMVTKIDSYKRSIKNPVFAAKMVQKTLKKRKALALMAKREENPDAELMNLRKELSGDYDYWIRKRESTYTYDTPLSYKPLISVVVPVYNVPTDMLEECVDSVKSQIYENWELILVDDCSTLETVKDDLIQVSSGNDKIHVYFSEENGGISAATNKAISHAKGEFIALLDCDDMLNRNALMEVAIKLNEDSTLDLIYSDEDKIDEDNTQRLDPNFKPDFSPDTLLCQMYICHLSVYRKSIIDEVGGLNSKYDGAQDYDLALRVTEKTDKVAHIPKILYHWRMRKGSTADTEDAKPQVMHATWQLKMEAIERRGMTGRVDAVPGLYLSRITYDIKGTPLVSVIIPSKDHPELLEQVLSSLRSYTLYRDYEIIVIDNGSSPENKERYKKLCQRMNARYHHEPMEFNFSRMCNMGADRAKGDYLLFLNDDTQIIDKYWMGIMLSTAQLDHVGAVGAKLYYPGGRIQHMGVVNTYAGPSHILNTAEDGAPLIYNRNRLDFDVIAVTGACLMVNAAKYKEIGGFDETFEVNYNDVDLCFKLHEAGYYNVIRNDAKVMHHESISRGYGLLDKDRLFKERERLYKAHPALLNADPFYNPNLDPFAPNFDLNLDGDIDLNLKLVQEADYKDGDSTDIMFSIDRVDVSWDLGIHGWCVFSAKESFCPMGILIKRAGDDVCYEVPVKRKYLHYMRQALGDVPSSDLAGFKTMTDRRFVEDGIYHVYFTCDGKKYDSGKKIYVGVKNPNSESMLADV